jgi:hypothetical protein
MEGVIYIAAMVALFALVTVALTWKQTHRKDSGK